MRRGDWALLTASAAALTSAADAAETVTYSYDALGRLTATSTSTAGPVNNVVATSINYDPAGNRSAYTVTGAALVPAPTPAPAPVPSPAPTLRPLPAAAVQARR